MRKKPTTPPATAVTPAPEKHGVAGALEGKDAASTETAAPRDTSETDTLPPPTRRYDSQQAARLLRDASRTAPPPERTPADRPPLGPRPGNQPSSPSTDRFELLMLANRSEEAFDDPPPSTQAGLRTLAARGEPSSRMLAAKTPLHEMRERHSLGDFSGALELAEQLLDIDADNAEALECQKSSSAVLVKMYNARLGPRSGVPTVIVAKTQLRWLSLDHKSGFILSLIDGHQSIESILDMSGMPLIEALRILSDLLTQRVIALR